MLIANNRIYIQKYTPQVLRVDGIYKNKVGRALTFGWEHLDWRDLAILHNKTIFELTSNIANKPYIK